MQYGAKRSIQWYSDISDMRGGYFIPLRCYHTSISLSPWYSQHCRQIKLSFQGLSWFFLAPLKDTGVSVFSEISSAAVAIIAFIYSVSRERAFLLEAREAARARRIASARVVMSLLLTDTVIWGKKIRTTEGEAIIKQTYAAILLKWIVLTHC